MNTKESAEGFINYAIFFLQAVASLFLILAFFYFPSSQGREIRDRSSESVKNTPDIPVTLYENSKKDLQDQNRSYQTLNSAPSISSSAPPFSSSKPISVKETISAKSSDSSHSLQKQSEPSRSETKPPSTTTLQSETQQQHQKIIKNSFIPPLEEVNPIEPYQLYEKTLITKDNVLERIPLIAAIPFYAVDATFDIATTALATAIRMPLSIFSYINK